MLDPLWVKCYTQSIILKEELIWKIKILQFKSKEAKKPVEIKINLASSNNSEIIDTLKTDELVSKTKDMDMNIELFERYMKNKDRLQKERYGEQISRK